MKDKEEKKPYVLTVSYGDKREALEVENLFEMIVSIALALDNFKADWVLIKRNLPEA